MNRQPCKTDQEPVYLFDCLACRDGQEAAVTLCGVMSCPRWPYRRLTPDALRRRGTEILEALPQEEYEDG